MSSSLKHTPLHQAHLRAGARMVEFGGWHMPLAYGSQIEEHHAVRRAAGMFDVSHMLAIDVKGSHAKALLRHALANDVARLSLPGQALYSCMLNPRGGVIDDLIVYFFAPDSWRLVVNAATADTDLAWLSRVAQEEGFEASLAPRRDLAMVAVQGPGAADALWRTRPAWKVAGQPLRPFSATLIDEAIMLARTGYTGEDGYEVLLPDALAEALWEDLRRAGVRPCGLGARDTLRLEAGLNLHGQDMDESVGPLQCGLSWTVSRQDAARRFTGREALEGAEPELAQAGMRLRERGVMRAGAAVRTPLGEGRVTSGTMSPTLGCSIALARLPRGVATGDAVQVQVRGKWMDAEVVKTPFVRRGGATA